MPKSYPTAQPPRSELLDTAFDVVRRYRDFGEYGSKENACKALNRRCKGFSIKQCTNAFDKATLLYEAAERIVSANLNTIYEIEQRPRFNLIIHYELFQNEIREQCPGFKLSTYRTALGWILFWQHLK